MEAGLVVESESIVGPADRGFDAGLDVRLAGEIAGLDAPGRLVERFADAQVLAARVGRIGRRQHALQEPVDRLRFRRFAGGALGIHRRGRLLSECVRPRRVGHQECRVGNRPATFGQLPGRHRLAAPSFGQSLGGRRSHRLPEAHRGAGQQNQGGHPEATHQRSVAPGEFLQLVHRAGRAGGDRLIGEKSTDVAGHRFGRVVAPALLFFQRLPDDDFDVALEFPVDRAEGSRIFDQDDPGGLVDHLPRQIVRQPAGQQFVEDHAEGVDVASGVDVDRVGVDLFGTHVLEGADHLTDRGLTGGLNVGVGQARDTEVEDLGLARGVDQDVGGLQIAVDDPLLVGVVDRVRDPGEQLQPVGHIE